MVLFPIPAVLQNHTMSSTDTVLRARKLAEAEGAIMVSSIYRLLPEAKVFDILEDIEDFWA